jgi:hypothetical protein
MFQCKIYPIQYKLRRRICFLNKLKKTIMKNHNWRNKVVVEQQTLIAQVLDLLKINRNWKTWDYLWLVLNNNQKISCWSFSNNCRTRLYTLPIYKNRFRSKVQIIICTKEIWCLCWINTLWITIRLKVK